MGSDAGGVKIQKRRAVMALLLLCAAVAILVSAAVLGSDDSSASVSDDWSFEPNEKVLTFHGKKDMPDYTASDNPIVILSAQSATSVVFETEITKIGSFAFYGCNIGSVTIPDSVLSIGELSFGMCDVLSEVNMQYGLKSIGKDAFYGCSSLVTVSLPQSVTDIGSGAFSYCRSMTAITLSSSLSVISEKMCFECSSLRTIEIPELTETISKYAFYGCSSITSVSIPGTLEDEEGKKIGWNSLTSIGDYAFYGCSSISVFYIPDGLMQIGCDSFGHTDSLKQFITSTKTSKSTMMYEAVDGVLYVDGQYTLIHYPSAKEDTTYSLPDAVTYIRETAFIGANNLSKINSSDNEVYASDNGVLFSKDMYHLVKYPSGRTDSSYTIPSSTYCIDKYAFDGASSLNNLKIQSSNVTFMDDSLNIGSFEVPVKLYVDAPSGYTIQKCAYDSYTTVIYGEDEASSPMVLIIVVCVIVVLAIILAVVLIIRRKNRI